MCPLNVSTSQALVSDRKNVTASEQVSNESGQKKFQPKKSQVNSRFIKLDIPCIIWESSHIEGKFDAIQKDVIIVLESTY